ncbi:hypothetical protein SBA3_2100004 [Candidatus Sulfopaludibacter sp. SbA3]|nr:hypothetical protein SBA3_2100004 [Candidatus Sulfopaludibacter sp. SbA3]
MKMGKFEPGTKIRQKAANFEPGTDLRRTRGSGFSGVSGGVRKRAEKLGPRFVARFARSTGDKIAGVTAATANA